jgi:hypothetical protein
VVNAKNTTGNTGLRMQLNLDTGSNYSYVVVEGDGSSAVVGSATRTDMVGGPNATTDSQQIYHIVDYSLTDRHKTILVRADFPSTYVDMLAERWANTAAVASVKLFPAANQFAAGSTFALYGVSA